VLLNVIELGHPIGFDSDNLERVIAWKQDSEMRTQALRTAMEATGFRIHVRIELGAPHLDSPRSR
jgi:hypothetical protein